MWVTMLFYTEWLKETVSNKVIAKQQPEGHEVRQDNWRKRYSRQGH